MSVPDESTPSTLELIAEILLNHGVKFIVIGGQAEWLHGSNRATFDVDLCYERSTENLKVLAEALNEIEPKLRGVPESLPYQLDFSALQQGCNFTLTCNLGPLDLMGYVEPIGEYDRLIEEAESYALDGLILNVISLDDLIEIRTHLDRPKDRLSLTELRSIKQIRAEREY